jgi:hypothetical protein
MDFDGDCLEKEILPVINRNLILLRDTDVAVEYNVGKYTKFNKPSQNGLHQNGLTDAYPPSYGTYEHSNLAFEGECRTRI